MWGLLAPLAVVSCGGGTDGTGGNAGTTGSSSSSGDTGGGGSSNGSSVSSSSASSSGNTGGGGSSVSSSNSSGSTGGGGGSSSSVGSSSSSSSGNMPVSTANKIDLLLVVDNSRGMADKQQVLSAAVPDLVLGLVNPRCIDGVTGQPVAPGLQPSGPGVPCPPGSAREFPPVADMHVGVITSSLGGHGSDACPNTDPVSCNGATNTSNNDMGHLISRSDPCGGAAVPTYQGKGFLAWDPQGKKMPPGEANIGDLNGAPGLVPGVRDLVLGAGQIGCGFESQLESMYRFLVDPEPYQSIVINAQGHATPMGTDSALLQQRADFLRSSSLLSIVMLTDENDCSIRESGQYFYAAQLKDPNNPAKSFFLPRARSVCAVDPNDPCCASCGSSTPAGCSPTNQDPECLKGPYDFQGDNPSLRCFDQKRRFGIDFLYPIDRYVQGLTSAMVPDRNGQLVPNPIFSVLDPSSPDQTIRAPDLVVFTGIVGVPWQDVARDPADISKGFKNADEMSAAIPGVGTTWDVVVGLPQSHVKPKDPHMIESIEARSGINPITGAPIAPVGSPPGADPIHGHEYTIAAKNDLQYACIFPLAAPRDCSVPGLAFCDCGDPTNDKPVCEVNPASNGNTIQTHARAYPGIRELSLIKALGPQGVVASICPAQVADPAKSDYGYRPVMGSVVERLKKNLIP